MAKKGQRLPKLPKNVPQKPKSFGIRQEFSLHHHRTCIAPRLHPTPKLPIGILRGIFSPRDSGCLQATHLCRSRQLSRGPPVPVGPPAAQQPARAQRAPVQDAAALPTAATRLPVHEAARPAQPARQSRCGGPFVGVVRPFFYFYSQPSLITPHLAVFRFLVCFPGPAFLQGCLPLTPQQL